MKKFLLIVFVMILACTPVQAKNIDVSVKVDIDKSTYTSKQIKKALDVIQCRYQGKKYKSGRVYKSGRYRVYVVRTYKDRQRFWRYLETRKNGHIWVEISKGQVISKSGDGMCTDGTYVGYRKDGKPMFKPGQKIISMYVYSDVDQYTDSISYIREWAAR